jgi:hypothetical protein
MGYSFRRTGKQQGQILFSHIIEYSRMVAITRHMYCAVLDVPLPTCDKMVKSHSTGTVDSNAISNVVEVRVRFIRPSITFHSAQSIRFMY